MVRVNYKAYLSVLKAINYRPTAEKNLYYCHKQKYMCNTLLLLTRKIGVVIKGDY